MGTIKSWSLTICLVSIICTLFEILFPQGKMEKIFQIVLGVFMLCSILVPLKNTFKNINFDAKKTENFIKEQDKLKSTIEEQLKSATQKNLRPTIEKLLKTHGTKSEKVNIIMDTAPDNCISIKKIEVFLPKGDENKKDAIKKDLEKTLELKIDVVVGSESKFNGDGRKK